jgi:hypothetical protein
MESSDKDGHDGHPRHNGHVGPVPGGTPDRDDDDEAHREWHARMIASWEAMRADLTERYGPDLAARLIDLQRTATEACEAGRYGLSTLIGVIGDLVFVADGDEEILAFGARLLEGLVAQLAAQTRVRPKSGKVRRKKGRRRGKDVE